MAATTPDAMKRGLLSAIQVVMMLAGVLVHLPATAAAPAEDCDIPSQHDPAVIKKLYQIGVEREVSGKVMLAMFEAGWVEAHMNNLPCGHLDSVGVFPAAPVDGVV